MEEITFDLRPIGDKIGGSEPPALTPTEMLEAFNRIAGKIKPHSTSRRIVPPGESL